MGQEPDHTGQPPSGNDPAAREMRTDRLMELVYQELRSLAAHRLRGERPDHTLQPTALVHEAYLRLSEQPNRSWESRTHFFRVAAVQIRRVLVDHARSRNRDKRFGKLLQVTLNEDLAVSTPTVEILALDEVLTRLDDLSSQDREIVELKFFAGMTEEEIAEVLGISDRTVRRRWTFARAWLLNELGKAGRDE